MYDVQLCTYVVHARYIPVTSDLRMRNRHVEVAGPERLSVRDNVYRTNNTLYIESYHASLRRRILVTHPNLFIFIAQLQKVTTDSMNDLSRLSNGLKIRRPKKKRNIMNESRIRSCLSRYDATAVPQSRKPQCRSAHRSTFTTFC